MCIAEFEQNYIAALTLSKCILSPFEILSTINIEKIIYKRLFPWYNRGHEQQR